MLHAILDTYFGTGLLIWQQNRRLAILSFRRLGTRVNVGNDVCEDLIQRGAQGVDIARDGDLLDAACRLLWAHVTRRSDDGSVQGFVEPPLFADFCLIRWLPFFVG